MLPVLPVVLLGLLFPSNISSAVSNHQKYKGFYIATVFHAAINQLNSNWKSILSEQLSDVANCGLLNVTTEFHVTLTISKSDAFDLKGETALDEGEDLISDVLQLYTNIVYIHRVPTNAFEYSSIRLLKRIAHKFSPENEVLLLYFHAKG